MAETASRTSSAESKLLTPWRWGQALVFLLAVALYFPALKGKLIWDDEPLVTGGSFGTHDLLAAFTKPFGNFYRPFTSASFAIENSLWHGNPFFYHQTNLLLHAITSVLVAYLALLLTKKPLAGILSGVFFAAQSMQVGGTAWIGGRTDVLGAFFLTCFLISLLLHYQTSKVGWLVCSAFMFFFAALSKEQSVAMAPAVPLSAFVFGKRNWKDCGRVTLPFALLGLVYMAMWKLGGPPLRSVHDPVGDMVLRFLKTAAHYGTAFLFPNEPSLVTFTLERYQGFLWVAIGILIVMAAGLGIRGLCKSNRELAFIAICALLVYIPVSNIPTVPSLVAGPYRCTVAGIGIACLFGCAAAWSWSSKRYVLTGLLGANLLVGTFVTAWGVQQWLTPDGFFKTVTEYDKHFMVGVEFEAHYLDNQGKSAEAAELVNTNLTWLFDSPQWPQLLEQQKASAITPDVRKRLRTNTGFINIGSLGNFIATYGFSLAKTGRGPEAAVVIKDALYFSPKDTWINLLYGRLVVRQDRAEAIRHWETVMQINPDYDECAVVLAHQRILDKNFPDAIRLLEKAMRSQADNGFAWLDLADAYMNTGRKADALTTLLKAESAPRPARPDFVAKLRAKMGAPAPPR